MVRTVAPMNARPSPLIVAEVGDRYLLRVPLPEGGELVLDTSVAWPEDGPVVCHPTAWPGDATVVEEVGVVEVTGRAWTSSSTATSVAGAS